jgi:hypothetical protein
MYQNFGSGRRKIEICLTLFLPTAMTSRVLKEKDSGNGRYLSRDW